ARPDGPARRASAPEHAPLRARPDRRASARRLPGAVAAGALLPRGDARPSARSPGEAAFDRLPAEARPSRRGPGPDRRTDGGRVREDGCPGRPRTRAGGDRPAEPRVPRRGLAGGRRPGRHRVIASFRYDGRSAIANGLTDARVALATNTLREATYFR